jgi:ribosomal protein S6
MTEYELFYLIGETKESEMTRIKAEVRAMVEAEGGMYLGEEKVEKRKLAYAIKREVRGTYTAQRFTTPDRNEREANVEAREESILGRLTRKLNLYRDILRCMMVRADQLPSLVAPESPSAVVDEVARETQEQKASVEKTEKKTARKPKLEVMATTEHAEATSATSDDKKTSEPVVKAAAKATKTTKKSEKTSESTEAELDKKLEEVLHI